MDFKEFGCVGLRKCLEVIPIVIHLLQRLIIINN